MLLKKLWNGKEPWHSRRLPSGLNLQSLMWVLMVDDKVVSHIHYIMVTVVFTKWTMPSCYVHALMLKHTLRIF